MSTGDDPDVGELVRQVRERAASVNEIKALADEAVKKAKQIETLMQRLIALQGSDDGCE